MKVFGIGLSRTGTSSLNYALRILGYNAKHFPESMQDFEKFDAVTDTTVASAYKYLDRCYPNSKFILTKRDNLEAWLDSCERLWVSESSHWTKFNPAINALHRGLYGTDKFDRALMTTANMNHCKEVMEYFTGRDNLLIVDVDSLAWEPLCKFLGKKTPPIEFPHRNMSGKLKFNDGTEPIAIDGYQP